jgi:UDP-N-acetylglucosamine 2-epimerase (non-hydrolysing)
MKILTILGTRPEIIRLSLIIPKLDQRAQHTLIHTGQNFSPKLKDIFFRQLRLRPPNHYLGAESPDPGTQLSKILNGAYKLLKAIRPDKVLILGDTNSGLAAVVSEKMGIPVFHMEAGNRCYDQAVPEEKNRRIIDAVSSYNLPYTPRSRENLLREGAHPQRIMVSGNPIFEVLEQFGRQIDRSGVLKRLKVQRRKYLVFTAHRAENVDNVRQLREIFRGLDLVAAEHGMPIIASIHPRTKERMKALRVKPTHRLVRLFEPFSFFDFARLERDARAAITDSGTVQEECCIFHVPTVTIRRTTERPETLDCGSNILAGLDGDRILQTLKYMIDKSNDWVCPTGYLDRDVSERVVTYLLGTHEMTAN